MPIGPNCFQGEFLADAGRGREACLLIETLQGR
jgi:hypothetical protein